ncbi:MAG: hypothetical protein K0R65_1696 [Crocinitomicaceae bacterium]|nr:hypothetical protein [Crocinitomicaceae bacterium]
MNEYSIFQLSVSIIDENSTEENELSETIFFVQVGFKNGKLFVTGDQNWFSESDFELRHLQFGQTYQLHPSNRDIILDRDITEDMIIDVAVVSDAGNLSDGRSEIEQVSTELSSALNISLNNIEVRLKAHHNDHGKIEIRNMNGLPVKNIDPIDLEEEIEQVFTIPREELMNHGRYFIILYISDTGEVVTDNVILPD